LIASMFLLDRKGVRFERLRNPGKGGVMPKTTVIVASPDDPPALRYLAPYTGVTLAEFYMDSGRDVLIVFDDLSKHADTYREISLLLRRPPGREAIRAIFSTCILVY